MSGHVEATETRLASEAGGRILTLTVKEGDRVQPGQTIMTLDTRDTQLAIDRVKAEQAAAEAQLRLVQAGSRVEDIRQAQAQVETARAEVSAARAELQAAEQDLERFETLLKNNSGSRKQRDDAATRRDVARDRVSSAESRVRTAEEVLVKASRRRAPRGNGRGPGTRCDRHRADCPAREEHWRRHADLAGRAASSPRS